MDVVSGEDPDENPTVNMKQWDPTVSITEGPGAEQQLRSTLTLVCNKYRHRWLLCVDAHRQRREQTSGCL